MCGPSGRGAGSRHHNGACTTAWLLPGLPHPVGVPADTHAVSPSPRATTGPVAAPGPTTAHDEDPPPRTVTGRGGRWPGRGSTDRAAARAAACTGAHYRGGVPQPLADLVHESWVPVLAPVEPHIHAAGEFLRAEIAAGRGYLPAGENVLRAFTQPLPDVRVLVVGQDPYPTPGHAVGLSFSVSPETRPIPRSLVNIFTELTDDIGCPMPSTGDLTPWTQRGVLLLNRVLTVAPGKPASHRSKGWEQVTAAAIAGLAERAAAGQPLVAILWGRDARNLAPHLPGTAIIESAHPSPLSARSGFFGSRPFSRANEALVAQGADPIDWSLP